jgi:organic hydroperoxide reductase OsmC/OhrA
MSTHREHRYRVGLTWEDDSGAGTVDYARYGRRYRVRVAGKPDLIGSADPAFCGDPGLHDPEDLLVASIAACHMLSYLALCARRGVRVLAYADDADGRMTTHARGGRFEAVVLHPRVTIAHDADLELARGLHPDAHEACYVAASCSFPVAHEPIVERAPAPAPTRYDLAIRLAHRPGALAAMGEALGAAGVSLEGGGGFAVGDECVAHFLVADAERAVAALRAAGIEVLGVREVLVQRLAQEVPGQLGALARAMADAGVNIECVYSDHDHQLILCVDDLAAARRVSRAWQVRRDG